MKLHAVRMHPDLDCGGPSGAPDREKASARRGEAHVAVHLVHAAVWAAQEGWLASHVGEGRVEGRLPLMGEEVPLHHLLHVVAHPLGLIVQSAHRERPHPIEGSEVDPRTRGLRELGLLAIRTRNQEQSRAIECNQEQSSAIKCNPEQSRTCSRFGRASHHGHGWPLVFHIPQPMPPTEPPPHRSFLCVSA